MFGLFGNKEHKKAANRIGVEIHRQLTEALKANESLASQNVSSPFITGYLYGFVRIGFSTQGYEGEVLADKYLKHICDGVLPGKLYEIFNKQLAALELAKELGKSDQIEEFEKGVDAGVYDSGVFNAYSNKEANNMFNYLTNQKLEYDPMSD